MQQSDHNDILSLHDCKPDKIILEKGVLSLSFSNGFWVAEAHEANSLGETVRTGPSVVDFILNDEDSEIDVYVFTKTFFGKVLREKWDFSRFASCVNNGKFKLEILYQYKNFNEQIFECVLWLNKKPYHKECWLRIPAKQEIYRWNKLCEDKKW